MRVHRTPQAGYFTIVPNLTARDHALSFTARGLLTYMLSLPNDAREDVKTLANKSVEGRSAISRALNELEKRGYLARTTARNEGGRISTRVDVFDTRDGASAQGVPATVAPGTGLPGGGKTGGYPQEWVKEDSLPPLEVAEAPSDKDEAPKGREGGEPSRALQLLTKLGHSEPRLHLSEREAAKLVPLVEEWLTRGATTLHVEGALTAGLPGRVHQAAALIRHRLTEKMPIPRAIAAAPARHECSECRAPIPAEG